MNANEGNSLRANGVHYWTHWDTVFLAALLACTVTVQWWLLLPPAISDPLDYFATAASLPDVSASHRHLRIGLLFPVWFFIQIFGYSEAAYYAVPFLSLMGLVAGTYLLAKYLFETGVAAVSAFLIVSNAYILRDSSHLLPDVLGTACLTYAVFLVALCGQNGSRWCGYRKNGILVLVGMLLGWSYLTREFTAILFPLIPALFWAYRIRWTGLLFVALGALVLFAVELLWGALAYGDPLVRLDILSSRGAEFNLKTFSGWFLEKDVLRITGQLPILFLKRRWGYFYVLLLLCSMGGGLFYAIKGKRKVSLLLIWVLGCWVFFTFMGLCPVLFNRFFLRMHLFRYWLPLIPAMTILGTIVILFFLRDLSKFLPLLRPKMVPYIVLVPMLIGTSHQVIDMGQTVRAFVGNGATYYREFRSFLHNRGGRWNTLWVEKGPFNSMSLVAPMYVRTFWGGKIWDGEIRYLNSGGTFLEREELDSGLVLISNSVISWLSRKKKTLPDYLLAPPRSWSAVFVSSSRHVSAYSIGDGRDRPPLFTVAARDWQIMPVEQVSLQNMEISTSREERMVHLDEGQQVFVVDPRGKRLDAPPKDRRIGVAGHTVRGYVRLIPENPGTLSRHDPSIGCFFYNPDHGGRRTVWAGHSGAVSSEGLLAFICPFPSESKYVLRIGLRLNGPVTLGIGDAELYVE